MYATLILMITEAFDGMKPASFGILLPFYVPFILEVGIRSLCDAVPVDCVGTSRMWRGSINGGTGCSGIAPLKGRRTCARVDSKLSSKTTSRETMKL